MTELKVHRPSFRDRQISLYSRPLLAAAAVTGRLLVGKGSQNGQANISQSLLRDTRVEEEMQCVYNLYVAKSRESVDRVVLSEWVSPVEF